MYIHGYFWKSKNRINLKYRNKRNFVVKNFHSIKLSTIFVYYIKIYKYTNNNSIIISILKYILKLNMWFLQTMEQWNNYMKFTMWEIL